MYIGESFVDRGINAAHINVLIGPKNGPVGAALTSSLAAPRLGHPPFMTILGPNLPVKPATLFSAKGDLRGDLHSTLTFGPAQQGVAEGITKAVNDELLPEFAIEDWVIIAAVWVNWEANDADKIYVNNREATYEAIERAMKAEPTAQTLIEAMGSVSNPFYTPPASLWKRA
jgi:5,6,7,8-tetrahydromethanopterin hydro-lyase